MEKWRTRLRALVCGLLLLSLWVNPPPALAQDESESVTPPRLSLIQGNVSFWRPGNEDWKPARANLPLAEGDALSSGPKARFELQLERATFLRADEESQVQLDALQPHYLRFRVTEGRLSIDTREFDENSAIEISTPSGAFTVLGSGYYRLDIDEDRTRAITRRGGHLSVSTANGETRDLESNTELIVDGTEDPLLSTVELSEVDAWDEWNSDRTDKLLNARSTRYVSREVYGVADLDRYGEWDEDPSYGEVWIPRVSAGWSPYSTGEWVSDPSYGWTWVDEAPWGWAPFHYGRWVHARSHWCWAPGPLVERPVYAPALVAFFGGSGFGVGVSVGVPAVSWVPLGWGEPVLPWWGGSRFGGRPYWGGWGGPRIVDRRVVDNSTNINITNINVYENAREGRGIVGVARDRFGTAPVERVRLSRLDREQRIEPVDRLLPRRPEAVNRLPRRERPDRRDAVLVQPVVQTTNAPGAIRDRATVRRAQAERRGGVMVAPQAATERPNFRPAREPRRIERVPRVGGQPGPGGQPAAGERIDRQKRSETEPGVPPRVGDRPQRQTGARPEMQPPAGAASESGVDTRGRRPRPLNRIERGGQNQQPGAPAVGEGKAPPPAPWAPDRERRMRNWRENPAQPMRREPGQQQPQPGNVRPERRIERRAPNDANDTSNTDNENNRRLQRERSLPPAVRERPRPEPVPRVERRSEPAPQREAPERPVTRQMERRVPEREIPQPQRREEMRPERRAPEREVAPPQRREEVRPQPRRMEAPRPVPRMEAPPEARRPIMREPRRVEPAPQPRMQAPAPAPRIERRAPEPRREAPPPAAVPQPRREMPRQVERQPRPQPPPQAAPAPSDSGGGNGNGDRRHPHR